MEDRKTVINKRVLEADAAIASLPWFIGIMVVCVHYCLGGELPLMRSIDAHWRTLMYAPERTPEPTLPLYIAFGLRVAGPVALFLVHVICSCARACLMRVLWVD